MKSNGKDLKILTINRHEAFLTRQKQKSMGVPVEWLEFVISALRGLRSLVLGREPVPPFPASTRRDIIQAEIRLEKACFA